MLDFARVPASLRPVVRVFTSLVRVARYRYLRTKTVKKLPADTVNGWFESRVRSRASSISTGLIELTRIERGTMRLGPALAVPPRACPGKVETGFFRKGRAATKRSRPFPVSTNRELA
jgi:hypothetical protein